MRINPIANPGSVATVPAGEKTSTFGQFLSQALEEVNGLQKQAEITNQQLVLGQVDDLHQVVLATEKAEIALQMTLQVRNKLIEAYQEVMRMQV